MHLIDSPVPFPSVLARILGTDNGILERERADPYGPARRKLPKKATVPAFGTSGNPTARTVMVDDPLDANEASAWARPFMHTARNEAQ
jgi:hypothetical protein